MQDKKDTSAWAKSDATKKKMSESAARKWISDAGAKLKQHLSRCTAQQHASGKCKRSHAGYFYSNKMQKHITYFSTYELRAITIIENDPDVYEYQTAFYYEINGVARVADILINKKHMKEIKPQKIINTRYTEIEKQINDGKEYCKQNNLTYEIWSEQQLGITDYKEFLKWSDTIRKELEGIDHVIIRKKKASEKVARWYNKWVKDDKVEVYCDYCKEIHTPLRITYEPNVARNDGKYVCEAYGGFLSGSKPKDHLRVNNPYAAEGKKQCRGCNEIKLIQGNFTWKSKPSEKNPTGTLSADCNACRTIIEKQKYHAKKAKSKSETPL
jgi:hypothetical protein